MRPGVPEFPQAPELLRALNVACMGGLGEERRGEG